MEPLVEKRLRRIEEFLKELPRMNQTKQSLTETVCNAGLTGILPASQQRFPTGGNDSKRGFINSIVLLTALK
jgi:hypothetical protein